MNPELLLRALHSLFQAAWPGNYCIAKKTGRTFPTLQCHMCPPCSCHTALRIPLLPLLHQHSTQGFIQGVWMCYTALSTSSTDLTTTSCQTGLWQIYVSYLPRKDQPEPGYICITFPCKLWCVQKGSLKQKDLDLDQHWAPAVSFTFKGFGDTLHAHVQACDVTFALRQRGSVRKFPSLKSHGRINPGLSPQWGEQHTFI